MRTRAAAQALHTMATRALFEERFPWCIENSRVYCPQCLLKLQNPAEVIVHLNDHHHWSREAIADWVETLGNRGVQGTEAIIEANPTLKLLHKEVAEARQPESGRAVNVRRLAWA